ncbi:MAG: Rieske (2Fe-2S) protein [Candidatus Binatia bacterium]
MKKQPRSGIQVGRVDELSHGMTKKFLLRCEERTMEGILLNYGGRLFAYLNRCRHVALSMDWVDNEFFTEDKRYLICANHGAAYEPTTGECVWGPCYGAFLQGIPLEIRGDQVVAFCPEAGEPAEKFAHAKFGKGRRT